MAQSKEMISRARQLRHDMTKESAPNREDLQWN